MNPIALTAPTVTNVATTSFTLRGRGANNCVHTQTLQLTIDPNPTVSTTPFTAQLCIGKTTTVGASGALTYTWTGTNSSTVNPYSYTAASPAGVKIFTVTGTSVAGCESAPAIVSLTVNACIGIEDLSDSLNGISVYPNPFHDHLFVKGFEGDIKIYDELGRMILKAKGREHEEIDTRSLLPGFYILKAGNGSVGEQVVRLIKN